MLGFIRILQPDLAFGRYYLLVPAYASQLGVRRHLLWNERGFLAEEFVPGIERDG